MTALNSNFQSIHAWLPGYRFVIPLLLLAVLSGPSAHAQLEEIIVTAEKREQSLQDVSISVEQISGDVIREQGLVNVEEILKNVPSAIVVGTARGFGVSVRGTGFDLPPQVGEQAIALNTDGVYNFRSESGVIGYFDLARVELLRGPQGTLYGRNATGGVMNVITADPIIDEFGGHVTVEAGDYSLLRGEAALNMPLGDAWAARLAVASISRDGFLSDGHNDADATAGRLKLLYAPNEDLRVVTKLEASNLGGHGPGVSNGRTFAEDPLIGGGRDDERQDYDSVRAMMQIDYSVGPGTLTVLPSFQTDSGYVLSARGPPGPTPPPLRRIDDPIVAESTQLEVRYASELGSRVDWVAGVYYYDQQNEGDSMPVGTLSLSTESVAVFGQVTAPISDRTRFIAGARNSWDDKAYSYTHPPPNLPDGMGQDDKSDFDWKLGIEHDVTDAAMLYLTASDAHRPGGFNTLADNTAPIASPGSFFGPEQLRAYEFGWKSRVAQDTVQFNGAVFYYDYEDYHLADIYHFGPTGLFAQFVNGDSTISGAEMQTQALFGEGGRFDFAVTYLDGELHETVANGPITFLLEGDTLSHSPEWRVIAGLQYEFDLGASGSLMPRLDLRYTGEQFVNAVNNPPNTQEAYTTGDFNLSYRPVSDAWSLNFYVKNISNEVVKIFLAGPHPQVSSPRTVGASANFLF